MKYILEDSLEIDKHWLFCEENNLPFIVLKNIGSKQINIFYDVTNYKVDLEEISAELKSLYNNYLLFFGCNEMFNKINFNDYYFFNFIVKKEHATCIAEGLYDFLLEKINS